MGKFASKFVGSWEKADKKSKEKLKKMKEFYDQHNPQNPYIHLSHAQRIASNLINK